MGGRRVSGGWVVRSWSDEIEADIKHCIHGRTRRATSIATHIGAQGTTEDRMNDTLTWLMHAGRMQCLTSGNGIGRITAGRMQCIQYGHQAFMRILLCIAG